VSNRVPPIDPAFEGSEEPERQEELEFELLEAEAELKKLANREIGQRFAIKWIAIATGLMVIIGMSALAMHFFHRAFGGLFLLVSPSFTIAMIVAPVASITAITVAIFIGAFRRFEDKDLEKLGNGVSTGAGFFRGG
jgi:hypothetical protein